MRSATQQTLLLTALLPMVLATPAPARAEDSRGHMSTNLPEHDVADASAPVVTVKNLLASERFWPYQVALVRDWKPSGREQPLPAGVEGVLVRVENAGLLRVDFGRDGVQQVPLAATDLLERANRIRTGELGKAADNLVFAIGPRLLDGSSEYARALGMDVTASYPAFLCVFADPDAPDFAALAGALAPFRKHPGVLTVLFPQGDHPDVEMARRLRSLDWPVAFLYDHLSEPYSHTLLDDDEHPPFVLLQTSEGRVLFRSEWREDLIPELKSALDRATAGASPTMPDTARSQ